MVINARKLRWLCFTCCVVLSVSCTKNRSVRDYDEAEVRKLVVPGVSRAALYARFGKPKSEMQADDGTAVLVFHRPFIYVQGREHLEDKEGFTGFTVRLKNDTAVQWDPITSGPVEHR